MNLPIDIKCDVKANFTKPVTILIQKIANATGVVYEPTRIVRKAKAESEAKLIKARTDIELKKIKKLGELELSDIQKRGVTSFVYQQERKQHNIEQIISLALPQISEDAPTENIDEDWLAYFFAHCELVSDKDMQSLWANMLANESSELSRFSKRTIDFVATMSREDAKLITNLCQFIFILNDKLILLIYESKDESKQGGLDDIYIKKTISISALDYLESIGIITIHRPTMAMIRNWGDSSLLLKLHNDSVVTYFNRPILHLKEINNFPAGYIFLTQIGKELASICGAQANNEFYDYVVNLWKEQDFIVDD